MQTKLNAGKIYLLPSVISEDSNDSIPEKAKVFYDELTHFVVERARTSRRFIKSLFPHKDISSLYFFELDKGFDANELYKFLEVLKSGISIGVASEAGMPCIADPGKIVVNYGHEHGISIVPIAGPSSIVMALIASGFDGQRFTFHGYLPNKPTELMTRLKAIEQEMIKTGYTQIFMETPYRNSFIFDHCMKVFSLDTKFCVASDIDSQDNFIVSKAVLNWKSFDAGTLHKKASIFLIGK